MNYAEGILFMQNLCSGDCTGTIYPCNSISELEIQYPGRKKNGDYKMLYRNSPPTHQEICQKPYEHSNHHYEQYVDFLEDVYLHGTNISVDEYNNVYNAESLVHIIYWITLQEEINYPQAEGKMGRRLPFCRYFEAVCAANNYELTIETVKNRCQNHGGGVPNALNIGFRRKPAFY